MSPTLNMNLFQNVQKNEITAQFTSQTARKRVWVSQNDFTLHQSSHLMQKQCTKKYIEIINVSPIQNLQSVKSFFIVHQPDCADQAMLDVGCQVAQEQTSNLVHEVA